MPCPVARLKEPAECVIAMQFLVMNLERKLGVLFVQILANLFEGLLPARKNPNNTRIFSHFR